MKIEKVVHAHIDCMLCNKVIIQYLGEPREFEYITKEDGKKVEVCIPCADTYYERIKDL